MSELLAMSFFHNALCMSLLLSGLFGLLSFFVVLRKMVFLGAGIAHTAFGGVALGILLGVNPLYTSLGFCVASAILISRLVRSGNVNYDTGIGIFFSFSMALGALLISLRRAYSFDLSGYLFGNILGVSAFDLVITCITAALFALFFSLFFQKLMFITFDPLVAEVSGIRVQWIETMMLIFLAVIIVVSVKMVGIILVSALVALPASFGLLLSKRYQIVLVISIFYAMTILIGGLFLSYTLDTPTGATVVVLGTFLYFITFIIKLILRSVSKDAG
ncbi:metal ABC transporter permease [candidate division KSB1 bacterium]|nr:metal ABC transporter permease [candidate division KSB1 bacterium]